MLSKERWARRRYGEIRRKRQKTSGKLHIHLLSALKSDHHTAECADSTAPGFGLLALALYSFWWSHMLNKQITGREKAAQNIPNHSAEGICGCLWRLDWNTFGEWWMAYAPGMAHIFGWKFMRFFPVFPPPVISQRPSHFSYDVSSWMINGNAIAGVDLPFIQNKKKGSTHKFSGTRGSSMTHK